MSRAVTLMGEDAPQLPVRTTGQQVLFVQLLRGIAPLLVMWAHLSGYWLYEEKRTWIVQDLWGTYFRDPLRLYQDGGHLGVIIFFLISGFIISYASVNESRFAFAVKRVFRLLPALAVALVVGFVALRISGRWGSGNVWGLDPDLGPLEFLRSVFLLDYLFGLPRAMTTTWTLVVEVTFYAAMFVLLPITRRAPVRATWYLLFAHAVLIILVLQVPALAHLGKPLLYLPFLFVGRVAFLWSRRMGNNGQLIALAGTAVLLFLVSYVQYFPGQLLLAPREPLVTYVMALLIFVGAMSASIRKVPRVLDFCGDISYSLYVLHLPVGMLVIDLCVTTGAPFTLAFLAGVAASVFAAAVSFRWVERPMQRVARRILAARTQGVATTVIPVSTEPPGPTQQ